MKNNFLALLICIGFNTQAQNFKTISFPSQDGVSITADLFETDSNKPYMLLCHQAGFSRGEYRETAIKFSELGYNCLAIDQRSGKKANGIVNKTNEAANKKDLPTQYLDAEQDIVAAIDYLYKKTNNQPIIIVGSSYSASLVVKVGNKNKKVSKVLSFSPGEYYKGHSVAGWAAKMDVPLLVTSSKKEAKAVGELVVKLPATIVTHFIPKGEGVHGSRALWNTTKNHDEYWAAVISFLKK